MHCGIRVDRARSPCIRGMGAVQIQADVEQGMGLTHTLAHRGVHGIINGLDTTEWDPQTDPYLTPRMRYTPATAAHGKAAAKRWLQSHLGLPVSSKFPVVAYIGRLTHQKGVDVLLKALYSCIGPEELAREALSRSLGPQVRSMPPALHVGPAAAADACMLLSVSWPVLCLHHMRLMQLARAT